MAAVRVSCSADEYKVAKVWSRSPRALKRNLFDDKNSHDGAFCVSD